MKHLRIKGEYQKHNRMVKVTILQQTHFDDQFGIYYPERPLWGNRMFKNGEWGLYAPRGHNPQVYPHDGHFFRGTLFLLGEGELKQGQSYAPFLCTLGQFDKLKELVTMYNEWGKTQ